MNWRERMPDQYRTYGSRKETESIMINHTNLDQRLRVPYSIGTGVPEGGDAEIDGYIHSLRVQGFCVIERVIPED